MKAKDLSFLLFLVVLLLAVAMVSPPPSFAFKAKGQIEEVIIGQDIHLVAGISGTMTNTGHTAQNSTIGSSAVSDASFYGSPNSVGKNVTDTPSITITAKAQAGQVSERFNESSMVMALQNFPNPFNVAAQGEVTSVYQVETVDKSGGTEMLAQLASVRIIELIDSGACIKTVENYAWVAPAEQQRSYGDAIGSVSEFRLCPSGMNTEKNTVAKSGRIAIGV